MSPPLFLLVWRWCQTPLVVIPRVCRQITGGDAKDLFCSFYSSLVSIFLLCPILSSPQQISLSVNCYSDHHQICSPKPKKKKKNPCQTCPVLQSQNPHTGQSQAFKAPKSTAIPTSPPQNPSKTPYQKILSILTTTIDNPFSLHAPKTSGTTSKHRCKLTQISLKPNQQKIPPPPNQVNQNLRTNSCREPPTPKHSTPNLRCWPTKLPSPQHTPCCCNTTIPLNPRLMLSPQPHAAAAIRHYLNADRGHFTAVLLSAVNFAPRFLLVSVRLFYCKVLSFQAQ